jgi:hypothetical protein
MLLEFPEPRRGIRLGLQYDMRKAGYPKGEGLELQDGRKIQRVNVGPKRESGKHETILMPKL